MKEKRIILLTEDGDILDNEVLKGFNVVAVFDFKEDYDYNSNAADCWREQHNAKSFELYAHLREDYDYNCIYKFYMD